MFTLQSAADLNLNVAFNNLWGFLWIFFLFSAQNVQQTTTFHSNEMFGIQLRASHLINGVPSEGKRCRTEQRANNAAAPLCALVASSERQRTPAWSDWGSAGSWLWSEWQFECLGGSGTDNPPAQPVLFGPAGVPLLALSNGLSLNQTLGSVAARRGWSCRGLKCGRAPLGQGWIHTNRGGIRALWRDFRRQPRAGGVNDWV